VPPIWGAAGLTASAGVAGWAEFLLLRRTLNARIGRTGLAVDYLLKLWIAAGAGAAIAWAVKIELPRMHPAISALFILSAYGGAFVATTLGLRVPEASEAMARLRGSLARTREKIS
jgi:putative peptidoglycan lipid II flippase